MPSTSDGRYSYDVVFTSNPDEFWGDSFGEKPCSIVNEINPNLGDSEFVERFETENEIELITSSSCFSYQDAMDGIVCIGWCYDDDGAFLGSLEYGEEYESAIEKLKRF